MRSVKCSKHTPESCRVDVVIVAAAQVEDLHG